MSAAPALRHRQVDIDDLSIHVVDAGGDRLPAIVFLHGWPQCWAAFEPVMMRLLGQARVVAMDLPGIGASTGTPPSNTKRALGEIVHAVIARLNLHDVTLVGHDVGGQIAYALLRAHAPALQRVVLMNIAIPGVDPWSEVVRNPAIWHFAFHAVPELPEALVGGRQEKYFRYFFDRIAAQPGAISDDAQRLYAEAYARPEALHIGFEWYRAFTQDEADNLRMRHEVLGTPVHYLRGQKEAGLALERYVRGLRDAGLRNVTGQAIPDCGHFTADEQPAALVAALRGFIGLAD